MSLIQIKRVHELERIHRHIIEFIGHLKRSIDSRFEHHVESAGNPSSQHFF